MCPPRHTSENPHKLHYTRNGNGIYERIGIVGGTMRKLFTVCVFFVALISGAAADSLTEPATQGAEQSIAFDNWEVRQGLVDHSYMLIGRSSEGEGRFWLNCDVNGFINVAVPLIERNGRDRLRSFPMTVWSDAQKRQQPLDAPMSW